MAWEVRRSRVTVPLAKEVIQYVCSSSRPFWPRLPHHSQLTRSDDVNQFDTGDEYQNLVRYISNYREGRRKSVASISPDDESYKKPWWKFWAKKGSAPGMDPNTFEVPDDWLYTELKQGLHSHELENRRKRAGWNELTTEKVSHKVSSLISLLLTTSRKTCSSNSCHISPVPFFTVYVSMAVG